MSPEAITRRALIAATLGAGAAATAAAIEKKKSRDTGVLRWLLAPGEESFTVPGDYFGLHSDHGLNARLPPPSFQYDAIRSHDTYNGRGDPILHWAMIEKSVGRYDWRGVERWIQANPEKTRIFVLFGCPRTYQKYPDEPWVYPYLRGGGSPPNNPQDAARFVEALLNRFPNSIHFIEIWNEPNFGWSGSDPFNDRWDHSTNGPGFFTGSASDMARMACEIRGVLPSNVKLMVGAWEGQENPNVVNSLLRYANAPDGRGGQGRDHVEALSVHAYTYHNDPLAMVEVLRKYRRTFIEAGFSERLPRYVTECGAEAPMYWSSDYPPTSKKIEIIRKWCAIPATLGYSGLYLYKYSSVRNLGDPHRNLRISEALEEMRRSLRFKRICAAAILPVGNIWLSFSDGSEVTI